MDFKIFIQQFKSKHLKAEKSISFSLLPLFVRELIEKGLNITHINSNFYQEIVTELFEDGNQELQLYAVDAMVLLGQSIPMPISIATPIPQKVIKNEAIVINDIIKTEHLVNNIPDEDDEGDPFYIPPEERITLRPEDMAPMEYDEDFCKLIGVDTSKRRDR